MNCEDHDTLCSRFAVVGDDGITKGISQLMCFLNGTFLEAYRGQMEVPRHVNAAGTTPHV